MAAIYIVTVRVGKGKEDEDRAEMMYEELGQEKDKTYWASTTRIKSNKNTGKTSYEGKKGNVREETT